MLGDATGSDEGSKPETAFAARSLELRGAFTLPVSPDEAFPLFSPLGEKLWVPGWDPELLHPPGASWERGLVFRTAEERGEAVWTVTALDHQRHAVEYQRVEAGRYLARVSVCCRAGAGGLTEVGVTYLFVGLSALGNEDISAMSPLSFEEKMRRWQDWIGRHLSAAAPRDPTVAT